MSTTHQCYCFLSYPSLLPPLSLFLPLSFSRFQAYPHFVNVTECAPQHSPYASMSSFTPPSSNADESLRSPFPSSLLSLPRSHHSCSQAPSLAATVSPPPPSELHCECLVQQPQPLLQYAALPLPCSPSQTQYSLPFGLRGGEEKHFKLQTQPGKQDSTDSRAHLRAVRI